MDDIRGPTVERFARPYLWIFTSFPHAARRVPEGRADRRVVVAVRKTRIGVPNHFAVRPLLFGLTEEATAAVETVYGEPGLLALWLERGDVDAALIPSIEFLRGVGEYAIHGPALVARGRTTGLLLVSKEPLAEVGRIAVDEFSRTPLIALRAVLDKLYGVLPDLCVVKERPLDASAWRDDFDAALLTEDEGFARRPLESRPGETCYDVGAMWQSLYTCPLVVSLWAYNDEALGRTLEPLVVASRDRGVRSLRTISESVARATPHDAELLHQCYSNAWGYDLGPAEEEGLRVLENVACGYQLLQIHRLEKVVTV